MEEGWLKDRESYMKNVLQSYEEIGKQEVINTMI